MKKLALSAILLAGCIAGMCQRDTTLINTASSNLEKITDTIGHIDTLFQDQLKSDTSGILSPYVFNRYLDTRFSYLAYQRDVLPTGNSASLDILENATKVKLALADKFSNKEGRPVAIVTAGAQATLGNGIANLFNGSTATTGTTLFLNFASLNPHPSYSIIKRTLNQSKAGKEIIGPFTKRKDQLTAYQSTFHDMYTQAFRRKFDCLLQRLKALDTLNADSCKEYLSVMKEKDDIKRQLADAGLTNVDPQKMIAHITQTYQDGYYNLLVEQPEWDWYQIRWLSGGITYTRNTYVTYDNALSLGKRFSTKDYDAWGINLAYNWYHENFAQRSFSKAWYANISYGQQGINSFTDLKAKTISANISAATSGDTTIIVQNTKSAIDISGKPFKTTWQHTFSGVYTAMFGDNRNVGINLLAQGQFSSITNPIFNTRVGLLIAMTNNNYDPTDKSSKAKVNFELFILFPDMADAGASGKSTWQNRVIGISTNIPFNKIFLQKNQ